MSFVILIADEFSLSAKLHVYVKFNGDNVVLIYNGAYLIILHRNMEMIVTRCVSTTKNASYIIVSTFLKS